MGGVFEYLLDNNGTEAASTYPLMSEQDKCKFNSSNTREFLTSYKQIFVNEEDLKRTLAFIGPLSVGVNGGIESFFNYWSGVYVDPACDESLNHAMVLIGYGRNYSIEKVSPKNILFTPGTDFTYNPPKDYWLLKNSWGTSWGENGFMRMERGANRCGITNYVLYPVN